jgi:polynucleotide 5'-kinase involved in rRNA processing
MDDFAIPGKTKQELEERTVRFLTIADKHNLYFKWSKCEFDVEKISILGTVIGNGEVRMEEEKIEAIKNWKVPTNVKGVESFLGFANFYWQFIKNFSIIVAPLNQLKGKDEEWK